jgi:peptidoglycan DL-endopeptidase CwlO
LSPRARRSPSRRGQRHGQRLLLLAAFVLSLSASSFASTAQAAPATIASLNGQLDRLNQQTDQLVEQYLQQKLALDRTRKDLADVQRRTRDAQRSFGELQSLIAAQAASAYVNGPGTDLAAVLTSGDPSNAVERMQSLELLAQQNTELVTSLRVAKQSLDASHAALETVEARQAAEAGRLQAKKTEVDRAVHRVEGLLGQLRAAGRARSAALQGRAGAPTRAAAQAGPSSNPTPPPVSGSAGAVVAWAYKQLGKPYQYGAAGPSSFDCSGLTMVAWSQAGVSLPHSAAAQYGVTMRISASDLRPGDLIFRYSPISHVSMYVGGGMQISATHTGSTVKLQSASLPSISGYGRPGG